MLISLTLLILDYYFVINLYKGRKYIILDKFYFRNFQLEKFNFYCNLYFSNFLYLYFLYLYYEINYIQ